MARDEPVPLGESLHAVVRGLRPEVSSSSPAPSASTLGGVFGRWEQAVGAAVAAHVQPVKLDGTTLVVSADDSAWATQLRFLEGTLRERLAEVTGARIDRLEVRVARPRR